MREENAMDSDERIEILEQAVELLAGQRAGRVAA
jgi:hypothetical protein